MTENRAAAIVLAAGKGTRMKTDLPKVMHPIAGRPMINHLLAQLEPLACDPVAVVVAPGMDSVAAAVKPHVTVVQKEQKGTAHAALCARKALGGFTGDVLILFGDCPFITTATIRRLLQRRHGPEKPAVVVLGFRPADPAQYGRLIQGPGGRLEAIVEYADATEEQRAITLCNSGVMAVDGRALFALLDRVGNDNAKKEYYLVDIVALARRDGAACAVVEAPAEELLGINSRAELAVAESVMQERLRLAAMADGATLIDPGSVFLSWDTKLGRDVVVEPHVVFGPGVTVGDGAEIKAFCHIEGARIEKSARIGPYARLRPGSVIGENAHIGNFVETKNARIGKSAKANHLTYLGDATVGSASNIGAGTITANYDGFDKYRTVIGANASIGSNVVLRAPVKVGDGAMVGAGSVIVRDVAANALSVARGAQIDRPNWASKFREYKRAQKAGAGKSNGKAPRPAVVTIRKSDGSVLIKAPSARPKKKAIPPPKPKLRSMVIVKKPKLSAAAAVEAPAPAPKAAKPKRKSAKDRAPPAGAAEPSAKKPQSSAKAGKR
jgi:bifunctional UDP-N-acetylglucosamine pyrophosphorylase/glucosamine-1-phosphate N-acetyltransferase